MWWVNFNLYVIFVLIFYKGVNFREIVEIREKFLNCEIGELNK